MPQYSQTIKNIFSCHRRAQSNKISLSNLYYELTKDKSVVSQCSLMINKLKSLLDKKIDLVNEEEFINLMAYNYQYFPDFNQVFQSITKSSLNYDDILQLNASCEAGLSENDIKLMMQMVKPGQKQVRSITITKQELFNFLKLESK